MKDELKIITTDKGFVAFYLWQNPFIISKKEKRDPEIREEQLHSVSFMIKLMEYDFVLQP